MNARRLSKQQEQEYTSRSQFSERVEQLGWVPDSVSRDLGEDFLVRIYDQGNSSGLTFFAQLKSTLDIERLRRRGDFISYPLETKDLDHWRVSTVPVVIVVWDIRRRFGYWIVVADAIAELDKVKDWHTQKTIRVRMPCSNSTDDSGFDRLRKTIANHYFSIVSRGKRCEIRVTLSFPPTPEGKVKLAAFRQHLATGDPIDIGGQYIRELRLPEWWTRLYGETDPSKGVLSLGSVQSEHSVPARIDFLTGGGEAVCVPFVDLRAIQAGTETLTISNEHQPIPLHFWFAFTKSSHELQARIRIAGPGANVREAHDVISFTAALAVGGRLTLTFLESKGTISTVIPGGIFQQPEPELVMLVEMLCQIQAKTGCSLTLNQDWSFSEQEARTLDRLMGILEAGRITYRDVTVECEFVKPGLELLAESYKSGQPIRLRIVWDDSYEELLGARIPLGPKTRYICGVSETSADDMRVMLASMQADDTRKIRLVEAEIVDEYSEWLPHTAG